MKSEWNNSAGLTAISERDWIDMSCLVSFLAVAAARLVVADSIGYTKTHDAMNIWIDRINLGCSNYYIGELP